MNIKDFNAVVKETFKECEKVLLDKGRYYGVNDDRLTQLKQIAETVGQVPCVTTHTLVAKHFVALGSMLHLPGAYTTEDYDAYILDIINYMILIRALLKE
jgi:hypothetical protein